jgi:hypothetical protein
MSLKKFRAPKTSSPQNQPRDNNVLMFAKHFRPPLGERSLDVEEVRLIGDLRIMHAKVDELHQIVQKLQQRHHEADINKYADRSVLTENIERVDQIYLWFIKLKEEAERLRYEERRG